MVSTMSKLLLLGIFTFGFVSGEKAKSRKPLITTDLFYDTYELLQDFGNGLYVGVEPFLSQIPTEDLKKIAYEQLKVVPPEVWEAKKMAESNYLQIKQTLIVNFNNAQQAADSAVASLVEQLERRRPALKGLVKKTAANFALFLVFMTFVFYIILRLFLLCVSVVIGTLRLIFCGILCCRLCRSGKKKANGEAQPKAKAKGKANGAQAAPASNGSGKAAPKAGKKK